MKKFLKLAATAALGLAVLASAAPISAHDGGRARGATTVTLNGSTLTTITGLGIAPSAIAPGRIAADSAGTVTASFPITKMRNGMIRHSGGIALTKGTTTLSLTKYTIVGTTLTAKAVLNVDGTRTKLGRIVLFDLTNVQMPASGPCKVTADLNFSAAAAGALTTVFAAPDVTGVNFGAACVAPRSGHRGHHDSGKHGH